MTINPYTLALPSNWTSSTVFSSPHSGSQYASDFIANSDLPMNKIRSSEDAYVDILFQDAPDNGAPLLSATAPRAYVDLNRDTDELDSSIIMDVKRVHNNPRIAAGLGVIPRVVSEGRAIHSGKITLSEAKTRIANFHLPYHDCLQDLMTQSHETFGEVLLIDCHSMPHSALDNVTVRGGAKPDVVIGDRFGSSCAPEIVDQVEAAFLRQDFVVARNLPFAGAYILRKYGRPNQKKNALQVEIDRSIYMDETQVQPHSGFDDVKARVTAAISEIAKISQQPLKYAAE